MVENPLHVYFADLHSHTGYSNGVLVPALAHDYARHVSGLDVFSLTDHLEAVDDTEWLDMRETAFRANEDGRFVVIPGLEWTTKIGHINIFDPRTTCWPRDLAAFYKAAAEAGIICQFNHPGDGTKVYDGLAYSEAGDGAVKLMEVRRATEEQALLLALKNGWHLAPVGTDDTHVATWGSRFAWTGILAPGLSQRNILDALRKRHCYSTLDRDCTFSFRVSNAEMGDILPDPVREVSIAVVVRDPNPEDRITRIELFEDGKVVQTDEPNATHRQWRTKANPAPGKHYYFVKVIQADGNLLWSAPIWLTVDER
jgi:predicted metal-dependent phosphoesterase TrpH